MSPPTRNRWGGDLDPANMALEDIHVEAGIEINDIHVHTFFTPHFGLIY